MKKICMAMGKEFSKYNTTKVLWSKNDMEVCPHCKMAKESATFLNNHPSKKGKFSRNE